MARKTASIDTSLVVLDSSCWLEFLTDTPRAADYANILNQPERLVVPVICIYEVIKKIARELGDDIASAAMVLMQRSTVVELDVALCTRALRNSLPLADSTIYATAQSTGAVLWTQDQHFEGLPSVRFFKKSMQ